MGEGNVQVVNATGTHWATVDNTGERDAGAAITALIEEYWTADGVDVFLGPGTYLIETPIVIAHSNIGLQGYTFGFTYPNLRAEDPSRRYRDWQGKTRLLVGPSCRDAIHVAADLVAFTLRNISICGQNGRPGIRPDIDPEQNGIRILPDSRAGACVVDYCQFIHLTHGILNEHPESTMDVWYITDNWIAECNVAIKLHASLFASVISRNGFHDMSGTVVELRSTNLTDTLTKEMVIEGNTCWNAGRLMFDLEGFRGGTISGNASMFAHGQVQSFARLRSCQATHVTGNTFVTDTEEALAWYPSDTPATGFEEDGERVDILTMLGCSDCTVSGNSLVGLDPDRPVIRVDADAATGTPSDHNHLTLNKVLPSTGYEGRPHVELGEGAADNLVLLPMAAGTSAVSAVVDRGVRNQICALPSVAGLAV